MAITDYAAPEDLGRYALSAGAVPAGDVDKVRKAITAASRVIDSYLKSRFVMPLVAVGVDVTRACSIIAAYDYLSTRGYNPEAPGDDNIRQRYEDVIRWLERIANGQAAPDVTDSSSGAQPGKSSARPKVISSSQRGWSSRDGGPGGPFTGN